LIQLPDLQKLTVSVEEEINW